MEDIGGEDGRMVRGTGGNELEVWERACGREAWSELGGWIRKWVVLCKGH